MYTLRMTDRAGQYFDVLCEDWGAVKFAVREYWNYPLLDLFGDNRDYDWDGLTEAEREAFAELV